MTQSERLPRWLAPPPALTAAFSSVRRPGSVLRVSQHACRAAGGRRLDEAAGQGGDPGEVTEEVERCSLAGQQAGHRPFDGAHDLAVTHEVAVGHRPAHRYDVVELCEGLGHARGPGQDAVVARDDIGCGLPTRWQQR